MFWDILFGFDIFISYTHRDSRQYADALFDAFGKLDYRVFLDKSELPPGEQLTVSLKSALKRSRSLVVIGTAVARNSQYVTLEIEEFTRLGRKLIPIDVGRTLTKGTWPGTEEIVTVPETVSNHREGHPSDEVLAAVSRSLTFTRRNKLRRRVLTAVAIILLVLAGGMAWTFYNWNRSLLQNERNRIDAELQKDDLRPKTAVDLSRADLLHSLLDRAQAIGYNVVLPEIEQRLSRIPVESARQELIPAQGGRRLLTIDPLGTSLVLFGDQKLEVFDISANRIETIWEYPRSGQLLWQQYDPLTQRFVYEIKYQHSPEFQEGELEQFDGGPFGYEREIFAIRTPGGTIQSLGLSRKLGRATVHVPPDNSAAISVLIAQPTNVSRETVIRKHEDQSREDTGSASSARFRMRLLATDGDSGVYERGAIISEVEGVSRQFAMYPLFVDGKGSTVELRTSGPYSHVSATDVRSTQVSPYTDAIYEPAVLDARNRVALLRNWFVRFPLSEPVTVTEVSLDYSRILRITINAETNSLVIHFPDRSVGWYDLSKNALVHKFQLAANMQGVVVSQDGKRVFVLRSDGRVEGWDLTAFAADGWAKRMGQ